MKHLLSLSYTMMLLYTAWLFVTGKLTFSFILQDPSIWQALYYTCVITSVTIVLNISLGLLTGWHLASKVSLWKDVFVLFPLILPVIAVMGGLQLALLWLHIPDQLIGVLYIHLMVTIPFSIQIFKNRFLELEKRIPSLVKLFNGSKQTMWIFVYFPLLSGSLYTVVLLTTVISLSQYAITAFIGGGLIPTITTLLFPYLQSSNFYIVHTSVYLIITMIGLFALLIRFIISIFKKVVTSLL
ncbi:hypothetical protein [Paenisporosarcina sp. TG-14]|uniref:hypothetical protein n=1 Tax=Paenisporosarcina sp. TG-14 TaxID=1231057 RepID=UPI0002E0C3F0|nr:hypothetical protein [Paenisporosarcina sp. TG-14]